MSFSNYLEEAVLNHVFRNTALPVVSTLRVGLFTAAPTDAGGGTEVTGGGYTRQTVAFGAPSQAGEDATITTTGVVTFTRTGTPVNAVAVGFFDAATAGNLLAWQPITSAALGDGEQVSFGVGQMSVTLR